MICGRLIGKIAKVHHSQKINIIFRRFMFTVDIAYFRHSVICTVRVHEAGFCSLFYDIRNKWRYQCIEDDIMRLLYAIVHIFNCLLHSLLQAFSRFDALIIIFDASGCTDLIEMAEISWRRATAKLHQNRLVYHGSIYIIHFDLF